MTSTLPATHLRYSEWASRKLLEFVAGLPAETAAQPIGNSHGGILKTLQHIYYADRVWMSRMEGSPAQFADPDPGPSLDDLNRHWWPILSRFQEWTAEQDPQRRIAFRNLKGDAFEKPVYQIVLHVVNHGTYHRGQVSSMLRQMGHVPPATDMIYFFD